MYAYEPVEHHYKALTNEYSICISLKCNVERGKVGQVETMFKTTSTGIIFSD